MIEQNIFAYMKNSEVQLCASIEWPVVFMHGNENGIESKPIRRSVCNDSRSICTVNASKNGLK